MFTICPKCALTLLVTAEDLRVAQGYVRCGRCSSVFNALARLTEERESEGALESAPPPPAPEENRAPPPASPPPERSPERGTPPSPSPPAADASDEEAVPDDALEFDPSRTDVASVFVEQAPSPQWSAATGTFRAMMAANQEAMQTELESRAPPQARHGAEVKAPATQMPEATRSPPADVTASPLETASAKPGPAKRASAPAAAVDSDDSDIDVELGPEQLASILHVERPANPTAAPSAKPLAAAPSPVATASAPAASAKLPRQRSRERPAAKAPPPTAATSPESAPQSVAAPPAPPATAGVKPPAPVPPPAAAESALERAPPRRILRLVRPGEGEWLISLAWGAGVVIAALLLLAQIVNHYRDELAASTRFNRPLTALYAALGVRLMPHWDVKAYDVRQLGASVEPGGAGLITVRASVKNGASQPQPLPLLRVTLQDRFGNRIAARDVAPRSYLSRSAPALLSAGERIDAEMGFVDPGANAVGFEIDACLPTSDGAVTCANDTAAR